MRRAALLICLLLLSSFNAGTAAEPSEDPGRWYALERDSLAAPARLDTVQATAKGLELGLTVPGFFSRSLESRGGPRGTLEIPGAAVTGKPGEPRLPVLRYLIEVPPAAEIDLRLAPGPLKTVRLEELGLDVKLLPVQFPVPKLEGAEARIPFVEDVETYAADATWPATSVELIQRAVLRGRHVALIEIRPIRYNPVRGMLSVWSKAVLHVDLEGGVPAASTREKGRLASHHLDAWVDRQVVSPTMPAGQANAHESTGGGAAEGAAGMLVVAYDGFVEAVTPLLDWKRKTGFKVELVRTSDLGPAATDFDVKAAIQQRYDNWSNPPLEFVLLVGDTDFCPIHNGSGGGNSQVTDNWYACLDGPDYLPDLAVARISTRTPAETATVVDKLLTYEQATFPSDTWIKMAGFIGTSDGGYIGLIEGTHDWCIDNFYTPNDYLPTAWSHGYDSCDRHYNTHDADTSEIAASIDEGRSIINYSGHGGTTSWQGPTSHGGYVQSDVLANTNAGMYPFVISNACITGTLNAEECFGETWQKSPGGGAIGFWGASNNSYWDEDDVLQRALHGNIFPMDETPPLGVIVNETKLDLHAYYGDTGTVAYYFDMYNLLSEPSLSLWTRAPRDLSVVYPGAIPIGESSFAITVTHLGQPVDGAQVAVRNVAEGVFEAGHTDATGQLTLILDPAPQNVATLEITVTGHDYRPWEGTAEVISPDSPWLLHREHALDDSTGGDGDGRANPGEELVIAVDVENVGEQPGSDLQGTLTTSTPAWCEVLDGQASFPDLAPHETGSSLPDHFRVRVTGEAPDGALLGFNLDWSAAGGAVGTTSFSEQVEAVDFALEAHAIDDLAEGNGNGVAGPGETVEMTLDLANVGHRPASGIHGSLSVDPTYVTLLQGAADYPDLAPGGQGTSLPPAYRFAVAEDAPDQEPIPFTVTLTEAGSGYSEVIVFDVMISSCSTTAATDVPHAIADYSTVYSVFDYPYGIGINDLNVYVNIDHTYQGDLRVIVTSPAGTEVVLHDRTGSGTDDIVTWYDTETVPAQPLSAFVGENAFGQWTLTVEDHAGGDTGSLDGWALEICGGLISPTPALGVVSHSLSDDGACDPDGIGDVGEQVLLDVLVRNTGWGAATGVRASVDCDAAVAVLGGPLVLPDLAPGEETLASFELLIGAVDCLAPVAFNLSVQCNEGVTDEVLVLDLETDIQDLSETEDVEHAGAEPADWSHAALLGTDDWRTMSSRNHTPAGAWSWFSEGSKLLEDVVLISPAFELVGDSGVEFWHWVDLEDGHDGGVLEISDDDGATWDDLGAWMTAGGYDGTLAASSPIAGRDAWTGAYTGWQHTVVDLAAWSGSTVRLRWRMACDDNELTGLGWWIDDVVVQTHEEVCDAHACGVPGEVELTDVRKTVDGVYLEWWNNPVCLDFRVWRSTDPSAAAQFVDVTSEDSDPTDTGFLDTSAGSLFWIIEGRGPDGDGPWGHYGQ